ncbi:hypothetical protein HQ585_04480 [candidate division KSB1 bacterium]|nr:hypothetical protein [candidate division KSB1 bacterium]
MTPKQKAINAIQEMPDSIDWADIEERISFLAAIDHGLEDVNAGCVVTHQQVKERILDGFKKIRAKQKVAQPGEIKEMIIQDRKR